MPSARFWCIVVGLSFFLEIFRSDFTKFLDFQAISFLKIPKYSQRENLTKNNFIGGFITQHSPETKSKAIKNVDSVDHHLSRAITGALCSF